MSKKNITKVKLVSTASTGFYFVKSRNKKKFKTQLSFNKYDPRIRKHVMFKEYKLT